MLSTFVVPSTAHNKIQLYCLQFYQTPSFFYIDISLQFLDIVFEPVTFAQQKVMCFITLYFKCTTV